LQAHYTNFSWQDKDFSGKGGKISFVGHTSGYLKETLSGKSTQNAKKCNGKNGCGEARAGGSANDRR